MTTINTNFPVQPTPFMGRETELTAITQFLSDPTCRLLTLIGPGGAGKTRLAIKAGSTISRNFERGVFFVNLQPVENTEHLVSTIADQLHIPLAGQEEPRFQLFNYLGDKEMLLVLDNFENLISEADFVAQLLHRAPAVKLIVTSRQALNLREEWLFPIGGLPYPGKEELDAGDPYSAVTFFERCAQRLRPDFSIEVERRNVIQICQMVDGLPLALEMAAVWIKTLSCADIADEIQRDIKFLTSNLHNVSPQHRSMIAVFDQTWRRLSSEEHTVFKCLSVFRGSFDLQAARQVAGASLPVLSRLVNNSILWVEATGRYQIHELIRQFAQTKLEQNPEEALQIQDRFRHHYIELVHNLEGNLIARYQREATLEVKAELENIRKAWEWTIASADLEAIEKSVMALSLFYQYQSRYLEGNRMLEEAETVLRGQAYSKKRDLILASVLCDLGWLRIRLGEIEQAEKGLWESTALFAEHQARPFLGNGFDPRLPLGVIASIRGDFAETARLGESILKESQARGEIWNEQFSYYLLTRAAILQGEFKTAQSYALKTYQLAKRNQEHWFLAYCLNELGIVASALGDHKTARGYFQASFQLRKTFDDPEGMAVALNHLGDIALLESDFQGAKHSYQQSQDIYQEINDQGGLATSLNGLAQVALKESDLIAARQYFLKALQISCDIQYLSLTISILIGIAHVLLQVGEKRQVSQILSLVQEHPASQREMVALALKIARDSQLDLYPVSAQSMNLDDYIVQLLAWLPTLELADQPKADSTISQQPLIDALTEREMEVLQQIARGLTNQQIADTLIISPGTAKWYTSQIYSKLGVKKRTQAVAKARELGLID